MEQRTALETIKRLADPWRMGGSKRDGLYLMEHHVQDRHTQVHHLSAAQCRQI
uniref:Uncharacterized protein n=1 Tax=Kalanchoe fedtschenkoi TaxID=63787 RepID=A0A7N0T6E8_KALFE